MYNPYIVRKTSIQIFNLKQGRTL